MSILAMITVYLLDQSAYERNVAHLNNAAGYVATDMTARGPIPSADGYKSVQIIKTLFEVLRFNAKRIWLFLTTT